MNIKYPEYFLGKEKERSSSLETFVYNQLLFKERHHDTEKIILEKQGDAIAQAIGRLLDVLVRKNLINTEEFHEIVGTEWNLRDKTIIEQD